MLISELDQIIGINFYLTNQEGVKGNIKQYSKDFVVEEIDKNGLTLEIDKTPKDELEKREKYIHFTLIKEEADTFEALRIISSKTKIPIKFFSYAGLKDKKAFTSQKISTYSSYLDLLKSCDFNKIFLKDFYYSKNRINIGDLWGNSFKIKIRILEDYNIALNKISIIYNQIKEFGGIPNFYGYQRFGIKRTVNHLIGKLIIQRRIKEAVEIFLCNTGDLESEKNKEIRNKIREQLDDGTIDLELPYSLIYENTVLNHLKKNSEDYAGALLKLPKNILKFFIHSYQAYLFNLFLSKRQSLGIPFDEAVEGDIIQISDTPYLKCFRVKKSELNVVNKEINQGRYRIIYPNLGYDTKLPEGDILKPIRAIILKENIELKNFYFKEYPNLSSHGSYRSIFALIDNASYIQDYSDKSVTLTFSLEKGSYATIFIREFLKDNDLSKI